MKFAYLVFALAFVAVVSAQTYSWFPSSIQTSTCAPTLSTACRGLTVGATVSGTAYYNYLCYPATKQANGQYTKNTGAANVPTANCAGQTAPSGSARLTGVCSYSCTATDVGSTTTTSNSNPKPSSGTGTTNTKPSQTPVVVPIPITTTTGPVIVPIPITTTTGPVIVPIPINGAGGVPTTTTTTTTNSNPKPSSGTGTSVAKPANNAPTGQYFVQFYGACLAPNGATCTTNPSSTAGRQIPYYACYAVTSAGQQTGSPIANSNCGQFTNQPPVACTLAVCATTAITTTNTGPVIVPIPINGGI
jgi:hypothetical protein